MMPFTKTSTILMAVMAAGTIASQAHATTEAKDVSQELMRKQIEMESAMEKNREAAGHQKGRMMMMEAHHPNSAVLSRELFEKANDASNRMLREARHDSGVSLSQLAEQAEGLTEAMETHARLRDHGATQKQSSHDAQLMSSTRERDFAPRAEEGDADTPFILGLMSKHGHGIPQDDTKAVEWFEKAAEEGDAEAQYNLGVMYDTGQGVPENQLEAARWYKEAAQNDQSKAAQGKATRQLSDLYNPIYKAVDGSDYSEEVVEMTRNFAQQGVAAAQYGLGVMHKVGYGVEKSGLLAYTLTNLAAAQDYDAFHNLRDTVREALSDAEVSKAQKVSANWEEGDTLPGEDNDSPTDDDE